VSDQSHYRELGIAELCGSAILFLAGCAGHAESRPSVETVPETAAVSPLASVALKSAADATQFVDVAIPSGINFVLHNDEIPDRYWLPEVMGGGVAWLDYDVDGIVDLYLMNGQVVEGAPIPTHTNKLYQGLQTRAFRDVTELSRTGDPGYGQGCAVGDFDADGFPDMYLTNYGANVLLHNNGDGTFGDVTQAAQVGNAKWGTSAAWFDIDADGDLDLYVVNYVAMTPKNHRVCDYDGVPGYCGPGSYEGEPDCVYLSDGDGAFTEAAEELGLVGEMGKGLAVVVLDLDEDTEPEIYVANDMTPNFLFTKSGGGDGKLFRDVATEAGCAVSHVGNNEASMGVASADFDADLLPDLFLTHFYAAKNTLYRNLGGLVFQDTSQRSRIAATSFETLGFGTVPFDHDLDGAVDLFVANGHVLGPKKQPGPMRPQLLSNDGAARFTDVSDQAGAYFLGHYLGRGAAGADYDRDGDLDIAVTHVHAPFALLRNQHSEPHHYVGFRLLTPDRMPPVGSRVEITCGTQKAVRHVLAGGSYLSTSDSRMLFGLGEHAGPVAVKVCWSSGETSHWDDVEVDRYWTLTPHQPPRSDG
jgi:hypothetical protein